MRITVDLSPAVHRHAGLGRYSQELLTALLGLETGDRYDVLYYAPAGTERADPPLDRLPARRLRLSAKPWRMSVLLADYAGLSFDRWLRPGDVFHATDHLLPPLLQAASVFTLHDLIYLFYPEYHLPLNRWFLKLMMPRFVRHAGAIIAVSENTRRDATRLMGVPAEKMTVIYEGVSPAYRPMADPVVLAAVREKYHLPPRFLLFFSTIEPRKNLLMLIDAYQALLQQSAAPDLVVAGRRGWLFQPVFDRVQALGLEGRIHFTDWVAEADAPALINAAEVFLYPSLYEGFGLPPLEAMACGVPVLCSNASSLPEVVGEGGLLLPPTDAAAWVQALRQLLSDPVLRQELGARGRVQAGRFTWEAAARETLAVYQRAAEARRAPRA